MVGRSRLQVTQEVEIPVGFLRSKPGLTKTTLGILLFLSPLLLRSVFCRCRLKTGRKKKKKLVP